MQEDHTPENDVHVTVSLQVSPLIVNLDNAAINRLLAIANVLMNMKKMNYNDTIMNFLSEAPSAGFFTVSSSSIFGNFGKENQENIYSIFGEYLSSTSTSATPPAPPPVLPVQRHNSVNSDYQSVNSEGHDSFHSIVENQDTSFMDDDFQSLHDYSSVVSGRDAPSDADSFSSISGTQTHSPHTTFVHSPVIRRRNSVFSITSATHSQAQPLSRKRRDLFVSLGGNQSEKPGDDYETIIESEAIDNSSISSLASKKRQMNLNVLLSAC